jgi:hypothetical protein
MWAARANSGWGGKTRVSWRTLVIDPLLDEAAMVEGSIGAKERQPGVRGWTRARTLTTGGAGRTQVTTVAGS